MRNVKHPYITLVTPSAVGTVLRLRTSPKHAGIFALTTVAFVCGLLVAAVCALLVVSPAVFSFAPAVFKTMLSGFTRPLIRIKHVLAHVPCK